MEGVLGASTGFGVGFSLEKGLISLFQERDLGLKVNLLSRNGTERLLQIGTPFYFSRNLYFLPQHTRNLFHPQWALGAGVGNNFWLVRSGHLDIGLDMRLGYESWFGRELISKGGVMTTGLSLIFGW